MKSNFWAALIALLVYIGFPVFVLAAVAAELVRMWRGV